MAHSGRDDYGVTGDAAHQEPGEGPGDGASLGEVPCIAVGLGWVPPPLTTSSAAGAQSRSGTRMPALLWAQGRAEVGLKALEGGSFHQCGPSSGSGANLP